jgi:MFS family permease
MTIIASASGEGAVPTPTAVTPKTRAITKTNVAAAVAGNVLEFYDFTTYTFFAVTIGQHYFPSKDPFISLILSVATFGVGFITRPIGGIVIGAYADRAGRKPAMMLTVGLMAIGMLVIALTPSYETIGVAAPILVVVARLLQGLALGGEVGPATSFLIEAAPPHQRGLYASWQLASQGLATFIAGLLGLSLSFALSEEAMQDWGWRIPFLAGVLIIPVALFMRRSLPETIDVKTKAEHKSLGSILSTLLTKHTRFFFLAIALVSAATISNYVRNYMATYATSTLHMPASAAMGATLAIGLCTFVFSLLGGWASDMFGRKRVYMTTALLALASVYPSYVAINAYPNAPVLFLAAAVLTALAAMCASVGLVVIPETLPQSVRSAGFAVSYSLAVTLFGGTAQPIVAWIIHATGDPMTPAWYMIAAGVVGLFAMLGLPETKDAALKT